MIFFHIYFVQSFICCFLWIIIHMRCLKAYVSYYVYLRGSVQGSRCALLDSLPLPPFQITGGLTFKFQVLLFVLFKKFVQA
jgi:hypothetical protein